MPPARNVSPAALPMARSRTAREPRAAAVPAHFDFPQYPRSTSSVLAHHNGFTERLSCHISQEACPFPTRFAEPAGEPGYAARGRGRRRWGWRRRRVRTPHMKRPRGFPAPRFIRAPTPRRSLRSSRWRWTRRPGKPSAAGRRSGGRGGRGLPGTSAWRLATGGRPAHFRCYPERWPTPTRWCGARVRSTAIEQTPKEDTSESIQAVVSDAMLQPYSSAPCPAKNPALPCLRPVGGVPFFPISHCPERPGRTVSTVKYESRRHIHFRSQPGVWPCFASLFSP
jgi:hypothetical protein